LFWGIALRTSQVVGTPNTRWALPILFFRKADMDYESVSPLWIDNPYMTYGLKNPNELRIVNP